MIAKIVETATGFEAIKHGNVIGFVVRTPLYEVSKLCVITEYQRHGIATKLLRRAKKEAKKNHHHLSVYVNPESCPNAIRHSIDATVAVYKKAGLVVDDPTPDPGSNYPIDTHMIAP